MQGRSTILLLALLALAPAARADVLTGPLPPAATLPVGDFVVEWTPAGGGRLAVTRPDAPGRTQWESRAGRAFVEAGRGQTTIAGRRGYFTIREAGLTWTAAQTVDAVEAVAGGVVVRGRLLPRGGLLGPSYTLRFDAVANLGRHLRFDLTLGTAPWSDLERVALVGASDPDERFMGLGEQWAAVNLKGRRVPIVVREQGIGRGLQPVSLYLSLGAAAGDWSTTYAPVPHYLTSRLRSLFLEDSAPSFFDLTDPDAVRVEVLDRRLRGRLLSGPDPLALIEAFTEYTGRMRALPDWAHDGLIVGAMGGPARIRRLEATLRAHDVPVTAFFLQDWVGPRRTIFGTRLWWSWTADDATYPAWSAFVHDLRRDGYRVLGYVNPFLVDARRRGGRDLWGEARSGGYLVETAGGAPYMIGNGGFDAAMVDLTDPAARDWLKTVLRRELLDTGVSGWMGDFGEALPFDARLAQGDPREAHNRWPELWAQLQAEVVADAGLTDEVVFFSRSGFTRSPGITRLFWLGDQLCSWDRHDGLQSALVGLLSSGLSGFSLNHGDAGGYTNVKVGPLTFFRRTKELLLRWVELCAFTTMLRTHEGLVPGAAGGHQLDSDAETLDHLARMTKIFRALLPYRRDAMADAATRGWPLVRHPWLHAPQAPELLDQNTTFLLGADLFVAPVLAPGRAHVDVLVPPGRWVDVWTGAVVDGGRRLRLPASIGRPAVLHREGSPGGEAFVRALAAEGLR
jgi:alpha-glucosidase